MHLWEILGICGILFLILEMFTPSMFFLNFVFASFFCAIISLYIKIPIVLVVVFFMVSFISFVFLRPIFLTKLSRANFYVNKDIRKSLDDARYRQQRMLKINFDSVMEIEDLQQKLRKLNLEMVKLRVENQELQVINRNLQKEI